MKVDLSADEVMEVFEAAPPDSHCNLTFYKHQIEFNIQETERHFWSPFLNLIVRDDDGGAELSGKYGPNTNVWTLFLAAYVSGALITLASLLIGFVQSSMSQPTIAFWIAGVATIFLVLVYLIGTIGKRIAHSQIEIIHRYIEQLFEPHIRSFQDEA